MKIIINNGENINSDFSKLEVVSIPNESPTMRLMSMMVWKVLFVLLMVSCIICKGSAMLQG